LRLLVDEDSQARTLVRMWVAAGHDVLTADAAGLRSLADEEVLGRAVEEGRVLLTRNCGDFVRLSAATPSHFGILGVYQDADPSKDMSWNAIVRAVGNVEAAGVPLRGEFVALNAWHW
jgi:predicted nuclease of predicted toxin-antitoxin system